MRKFLKEWVSIDYKLSFNKWILTSMNCQAKLTHYPFHYTYFDNDKNYFIIFRRRIGNIWKYGLNEDDCKHTKKQIMRILRDTCIGMELGRIYEIKQ